MSRIVRLVLGVTGAVLYVFLPLRLSDYGLAVLNLAGIAAVGALGLNLATGYAGQISLGHAAFLGAGAYACAAVGGSLGLPVVVWLPAAAVVGGVLGAAVAPFAVRFRGHTLAVVTLALLFLGQHVFRTWRPLTGGNAGRADLPSPEVAGLDVGALRVFGRSFTPDQAWFWLAWALVAVTVLVVANVVRGRPGRAMVAVRTGEEAAAVLGVDVVRTKVTAFVAAGALAGVSGALYGSYKHYVAPDEWSLLLSVEYLAMVLIGGAGTVLGPVLGALFVTGVPRLVEEISGVLPFVGDGTGAGLSVAQLNQLVFGLLLIAFVVAEPRGLSRLLGRGWRWLARVTPRRARPV